MTKIVGITDDSGVMRCRILLELIKMAGAQPLLIPRFLDEYKPEKHSTKEHKEFLDKHLENVADLLNKCHAIIIPGNAKDIHPHFYGQNFIHDETRKRLPELPDARQDTELAMVNYAIKNQLPLLGICGGMHLVNCAMGGTLIQHLLDDKRVTETHRDQSILEIPHDKLLEFEKEFCTIITSNSGENIYHAVHDISVKKDSILGEIYLKAGHKNLDKIGELSIHHQGCFPENLAPGLKITATSADGLVEAAELENHSKMFLLVQTHPECNVGNIALPLIKRLVTDIEIPLQITQFEEFLGVSPSA